MANTKLEREYAELSARTAGYTNFSGSLITKI
jgi:hypothetical protein